MGGRGHGKGEGKEEGRIRNPKYRLSGPVQGERGEGWAVRELLFRLTFERMPNAAALHGLGSRYHRYRSRRRETRRDFPSSHCVLFLLAATRARGGAGLG